ncbi:MAG TPA: hypothetical protein VF406_11070 [Thermodesulfobacteriota bacterium]
MRPACDSHPPRDVGPVAEARQEQVRRLSGACFILGGFCIALATHTGGLLEDPPQAILIPALLSMMIGAFCLTFPWTRYDPRWFLLACPAADGLILWGALLSGGADSPVVALFYLVVALAGAYRGGALLGLQVVVTAGVASVPTLLTLAPGAPRAPVVATAFIEFAAMSAIALAARAAVPAPGPERSL